MNNSNLDNFLRANTLQSSYKISNNSMIGLYATTSTSLYNPSANYTATGMTRSVASIGNAVSESMVAGNKIFNTPENTINYVVSIVSVIDPPTMIETIKLYDLYMPTPDEVMEMLLYSFQHYWRDEEKEKVINVFLSSLSDIQLTAVMYTNDLFFMKKHNDKFMRELLGSLSKRVTKGSVNHLEDINNTADGVMNLVYHICMSDVKGKTVVCENLIGTELLEILASTARNITLMLKKYKKLFRTFFTTSIMPIDIARVTTMLRDTIVLSDTDSTCGSYDKWVEWYFGEDTFSPESLALSATVMTINTQVIDHFIRAFVKNMNIKNELSHLIKMKNEFTWASFMVTNKSKHYMAEIIVQEGSVYKDPILELKGVHLISSTGNQYFVEDAHAMGREINQNVSKNIKMNAYDYIKRVADAERKMLEKINSGDINIFKKEKIKKAKTYKLENKSITNYFHYMFWQEVFQHKYGKAPKPEYAVIKIATKLLSKTKLNDYVASIEDLYIRRRMENSLKKHGKTILGTIKVPLTLIGTKGIPKEILDAMDKKRIVLDSLNVYYIILESCGIYRKNKLLFSEMGY